MKTHIVRVAGRPALLGLTALSIILAAAPDGDAQQGPVAGIRKVDPRWHALVGADVVTEPGRLVKNATVVLRDGVIVSVTPGGRAPDGARIWDYAGLTVYPGLIEPHLPVDAPAPAKGAPGNHWNAKVMPQRSALSGEGVSTSQREKLLKMGFTAAALAPKDGVFRGSSAVVLLTEPADADSASTDPAIVRDHVYQEVAFESGGFGRPSSYPGSEMGAIALIRQTLSDVQWRAETLATVRREPDRFEPPAPADALDALGAVSLASGARSGSVKESDPLLFNADDELEILRAGKIAREFGRKAVVLGSGTEFRRLGAVVAEKLPLIVPLAFPKTPSVKSLGDQNDVTLRELMGWEQAPTNLRRLAEAGATVAITTDKGGKGANFADNLRSAIKHGLSADDALAMLTINPAKMLGVEDRLGRIAPGYLANLVVVDGPLFEKESEIRDVWVGGRRDEIKAKPAFDLNGQWAAAFLENGATHAGALTIKKSNVLTFDFEEHKDVKARDVSVSGDTLTFLLNGEDLGESGVFTASGVIRGETITGSWINPAGQISSWSAARTSAGKADDSKVASEDDKKPDDDAIGDIPEQLPTPFGAFGFLETPPQENLLITNATIWAGGPAGIIENGTLVVSKGKIVEVRRGVYDNVMGMRIIDARGRHITPGLIDAHSHTAIGGGVNEGTHAITSEVRIQDVIDPDDISIWRELAGGLTTINQLHGSANPIGGQNSVVKLRWGVSHPDDMRLAGAPEGIKFALGENVKQSNWGDNFRTRYPQTRMGVDTIIRDRFIMAREYAAEWDRWSRLSPGAERTTLPPRRDLQLEALVEILDGSRLVHSHSYRQDEIFMLTRVAKDFGFRIGTFQHVLEGYKVAEAIKEFAIGASTFSDWWAYKFEVYDAIPYNGAIMTKVGVPVTFNSDSDELARRLNTEAGKAVKYGGVPPAEAIKFVTANAALQLGIGNHVGSLAEGMDADFVIWSGDPLSYFSRAEATYIDGREIFSLEKDRRLRENAQAERQRIIQKILAKKGAGKAGDKADKPAQASDESERGRRNRPAPNTVMTEADIERERMLDLLRAGGDPTAHQCEDFAHAHP